MPLEIWFPTVVFYEDVAVDAAFRRGALDAVRERMAVGATGDVAFTADTAPNDLHLDPRVAALLELFRPALARLLFEHLRCDPARVEFHVGRCWPVLQRGNELSGAVHSHRGAVFSGVFFLQAPPGSGALTLYKPCDTLADGLPKAELTALTFPSVTYEAVENRLIVFASELRHNRQPNTGVESDARIAIAFDLFALSDLDAFGSGPPRREYWRKLP